MSKIGTGVIVAILACIAIQVAVMRMHSEKYSVSADVTAAIHVIKLIHVAETRCKDLQGTFVARDLLGQHGCGGLAQSLTSGVIDGYNIQIGASHENYEVLLIPAGDTRMLSFYSDETQAIRVGTREHQASARSGLLNDLKSE